jgi:DNA-binding transcriptional MerR regulator
MMFSIGEFSKMTAMSIKSLRLYHEKEILVPAEVDVRTGYRYYNDRNYETAKAVKILKQFDFSLPEIKAIIEECRDEADILGRLEKKQKEIEAKLSHYHAMSHRIAQIIRAEKEAGTTSPVEAGIIEKELASIRIAGYRMQGRYEEVGKGFQIIRKTMGLDISGKPMTLHYDGEYKEEGADFEPCFAVRKAKAHPTITIRALPGGHAVTLIHRGAYEKIGESYQKVFSYIHEKEYPYQLPIREVYLKGPGLIFSGNPGKYLTEIIVMVDG